MANTAIINKAVLNQLRELLGDQCDVLLQKYLNDSKTYLVQLETHAKGEKEILAKTAHPLKSSSYQIGAEMVGDIAERIENAAFAQQDIDYTALVDELRIALGMLEKYLAEEEKISTATKRQTG